MLLPEHACARHQLAVKGDQHVANQQPSLRGGPVGHNGMKNHCCSHLQASMRDTKR
jgi:hypothetical protein